jgi:hypothetical protein
MASASALDRKHMPLLALLSSLPSLLPNSSFPTALALRNDADEAVAALRLKPMVKVAKQVDAMATTTMKSTTKKCFLDISGR